MWNFHPSEPLGSLWGEGWFCNQHGKYQHMKVSFAPSVCYSGSGNTVGLDRRSHKFVLFKPLRGRGAQHFQSLGVT